jgi:hypothetical protein
MPYKFALDRIDYSDLASGKVFLSVPGHPAFPVRLASEILQRCLAIRAAGGITGRITLYDPCCGAAYHLSVLAFLHWESLRGIIASDIDPHILPLAERNLSMLSIVGFDRRREELAEMQRRYGKASHTEALAAADRLRKKLIHQIESHPVKTRTFQADALERHSLSGRLENEPIDIVLTDVPYGRHSKWKISSSGNKSPAWLLLDSLHPTLQSRSIIAISSDKQPKVSHDGYTRIERFQIGKRQVVIWKPVK